MSVINFEPILSRAERRAIVAVLRAHPEWTLGQVCKQLERDVPVSVVLSKLTLGELLLSDPDPDALERPPDGGPAPDRGRLEAARRMDGERFEACICEVLDEASDRPVGSAYLLARVGGPRWKLKTALLRLIAAGTVERSGTTSGTRYRLASHRRNASEASDPHQARPPKPNQDPPRGSPRAVANNVRGASEASGSIENPPRGAK
jgi:hypothetical protein